METKNWLVCRSIEHFTRFNTAKTLGLRLRASLDLWAYNLIMSLNVIN
jgi:hypothetical protein